jgi:hypothetical protein
VNGAARSIGLDAAEALHPGARGVVAAAFARSIYVRFDARWVCFGDLEIGSGPLNVPCLASTTGDWLDIASPGQSATVTGSSVTVGDHCRIDLARAPLWRPPPYPRWTARWRKWALHQLDSAVPPVIPSEGLSCFMGAEPTAVSRVAHAALPAVLALADWIADGNDPPPPAIFALLGLGPGLTPSGDDFLAGSLACLRCTRRTVKARSLWQAIEARGSDATVAVSWAHLRCAARGRLGEDLHAALTALMTGQEAALQDTLQTLCRSDSNSPWDCLAGICVTLRALGAASRLTALHATQRPLSAR